MRVLEVDVVGLVLLAALLHAGWNAVAKAGSDRLLTLTGIVGVSTGIGCVGVISLPAPAVAAWPYLGTGALLHLAYYYFLLRMYRFGDLSFTYPVARGLAPLLVAGLSAVFAGEVPSWVQGLGLALASASLASMTWLGARPSADTRRALLAAALTGAMIGLYSFVDGQGARAAGNAWSYVTWSFVLDGVPLLIVTGLQRRRAALRWLATPDAARSCVGGLIASGAYALVLWAMTQGAMAEVSALRETSVIFGAWIGARLLREPFGRARILAATGVALGLLLLHAR